MMNAVADDLSRARQAFAAWRSEHGRGRLPAALWALALDLLDHHSVAEVARELGLNQARIRAKRSEARTRGSGSPKTKAPGFVQLSPALLAPRLPTLARVRYAWRWSGPTASVSPLLLFASARRARKGAQVLVDEDVPAARARDQKEHPTRVRLHGPIIQVFGVPHLNNEGGRGRALQRPLNLDRSQVEIGRVLTPTEHNRGGPGSRNFGDHADEDEFSPVRHVLEADRHFTADTTESGPAGRPLRHGRGLLTTGAGPADTHGDRDGKSCSQ